MGMGIIPRKKKTTNFSVLEAMGTNSDLMEEYPIFTVSPPSFLQLLPAPFGHSLLISARM